MGRSPFGRFPPMRFAHEWGTQIVLWVGHPPEGAMGVAPGRLPILGSPYPLQEASHAVTYFCASKKLLEVFLIVWPEILKVVMCV